MNFLLKQIRQIFLSAAVRYFAQPATQYSNSSGSSAPNAQIAAASPLAVDINGGDVYITNAAATTLNFPVPQAGQDDFKRIKVFSTTAFAHVCSFGANKLNGNKTSYTWTAAVAGQVGEFFAYQGVWYAAKFHDAAAFAQYVTLA